MTKVQSSSTATHQVYFTLQTSDIFLFQGWKVSTVQDLTIVFMVVGISAIIYEALQAVLKYAEQIKNKKRLELGYIMMLYVMTFNVWLLLITTIAAGFGYFVSRPILFTLHSRSADRQLSHSTSSRNKTSQLLKDTMHPLDVIDHKTNRELQSSAALLKHLTANSEGIQDETTL